MTLEIPGDLPHIHSMKQIAKISVLVGALALTMPQLIHADTSPPNAPSPEAESGTDLMSRGFQLLLEGLSQEMSPMAEELSDGWQELLGEMKDMSVFHPPEVLPNGDIIIRRKIPLVPERPPAEGETDL